MSESSRSDGHERLVVSGDVAWQGSASGQQLRLVVRVERDDDLALSRQQRHLFTTDGLAIAQQNWH